MSKHNYSIFFFPVTRDVILAQNQIADSSNYKSKKLRILSERMPKDLDLPGIKDGCTIGIITVKEYSDTIKEMLKKHPEKEGGFQYTIFEVGQDSEKENLKKRIEVWDQCDWYL